MHGGGSSFHGGNFHGGNFHGGNFYGGRFNDGRFFGGGGFGLGYGYWPGYSVYDYAPSYYGGYYDTYPGSANYYYGGPADDLMPYASGVGPTAPIQDDTAHIRVTVPENAKVWFDGSATNQEGAVRDFVSPPLRPGHEYTYDIKATWLNKDGKEVTRTRQIDVRSGSQNAVDLTR